MLVLRTGYWSMSIGPLNTKKASHSFAKWNIFIAVKSTKLVTVPQGSKMFVFVVMIVINKRCSHSKLEILQIFSIDGTGVKMSFKERDNYTFLLFCNKISYLEKYQLASKELNRELAAFYFNCSWTLKACWSQEKVISFVIRTFLTLWTYWKETPGRKFVYLQPGN